MNNLVRHISILAVLLAGCATPRQLVTDPAPSREAGDTEQIPSIYHPTPISVLHGKASYYWKPQPTASGERFNPTKLTAAHKSLPMHTVIRVTNLKNGKHVIVRINDRGPYVRGRIVDLSKTAAEKIAMITSGVVPVKVEVLKKIDLIRKPNRKLRRTNSVKSLFIHGPPPKFSARC